MAHAYTRKFIKAGTQGIRPGGLHRDRDVEAELFARARKQAESGRIRVHVPPAMMKRWLAEAQEWAALPALAAEFLPLAGEALADQTHALRADASALGDVFHVEAGFQSLHHFPLL